MRNSQRLNSHNRFFCLPVICLAGVLALSLIVNAQPNPEKGLPFITNYTPKTFKALPQAWCAIEDTQGIMYFGVQSTILEYDGVKWRKVIFKGTPPPVVRSLARDNNGVIYYGAAADFGYLSRDSLGQTHAVSLLQYIPESYRNFFDVWTIYIDKEEIYFQSREYIFKINEKKEVKTWIPKTKFMYAFFYDGNYFVHQQGVGLLKLIKDSLQLIPGSEFLGQERMQVMLPYTSAQSVADTPGQYLLGLFYSGLFLFDGKTFAPFKTEADDLIKSATLYKGAKLSNGNFALSTTGKGLAILSPTGKIVQLINRDVGLQDESVYGVYSDSKGTLWLALDNGISRVETNSPLTQFTNQSGINTATLSIQRFGGKLYVGTTNGLLKFNNQTSGFDQVMGVPPNQTFKLVPDGNSLLVPNDGLFHVINEKALPIRSSIGGDLQLSGLYISKAHPDMMLGGATFGVVIFSRDKATRSWHFKGHIPNLDDQFWTFSEEKDGTIWCGTQSAVVYRIAPAFNENGEPDIQRFTFERFGEAQGLKNSSGGVYNIKGESWFVGDSSLFKFDANKKRFYPDTTFGRFTKGGGISEFDIVEDHAGRVWLRFGKETILATPQPGGKYKIDRTPFLPIADRSFSAIYPEENGIVWICTTDGLIRYNETLEKNYALPFKTLLRHVTAGKDILNPDPLIAGKKKVSVSFKNNTLRFEYAAPFFEQEDKILYQTWLEGFEETWSGYDNNYYKEYTNLPAGKYHFHVRAKNVYEKISEESVYTFTVKSPWYAAWWAYLLYAIIGLSILYVVVRNRTRHLKEKHRELEKTVSERTVQLRQRVEELAVINSVQDALVREMDMQAIYDLVGNKIRDVFNAQAVIIATLDHQTATEHFKYAIENGERFYLKPRPLDKLRTHLIQKGQKVVINNNEQALNWFGKIALPGTKPMQSGIFVPLIVGEKATGYISLQNVDKENAFTETDIRLSETLANSMSVALENARLFDETNRLLKETEQRTAELSVINSVQVGLAKELDMQGIYDLVGDRLCDLFPDTQTLVIRTFDHVTGLEYFQYAIEKGQRMKVDPQPFMWANKSLISTKRPIDIREKYVEISKQHGGTGVTKGQPPKSAVFVPMLVGDIVKGSISLQNVDKEHAFTDSDLRLLTTITNSMSVALENARLFDETNRLLKETEQRTAELAVINNVQEGLVREMNIQAIYDLVGNRICELFDTQTVLIRTFDQRTELEHWQYVTERGQRLYSTPRPLIWANQLLIQTRQALLINENYVETAKKHGGSGVSKGLPPKSALFVPMVVGDMVRGSVSLQNVEKEHAFSESDLRLLTTLTNSMSVALENARLFDETNRLLGEAKQRANELSTVNNVSQALASQLNPDELIKLVGDQMRDLFKANIVYLALLDSKSKMIHFVYQYGDNMESMLLGEGLTSKIILSGEPLLINKDLQELRVQIGVKQVGLPAASYLGVPIPVGNEVIGVLSVQSTEQESRFNENDLRLLSTIAASVGVALRKAKLFEEVQLAKMDAETARKAAEKANEAKSAFLSTVSHELRTPLTSVLGFTKIIKKRLEEKIFPAISTHDAKIEKTVQQISDNLNVVISEGERLTNLINEVLDLAKIEAGKMEWNMESVSMQEVAERAISATTSLFDQKNLALKVNYQENLPLVSGDRDKLIQVMVNLISNAVKFTAAGTITCSISQGKNEIITGIRDTGIGIAPADHDAVFEQFKQVVGDTLTDKPKGTGLGLPICKEIVEHHDGRIWLESETGKGSTFFFAIPVQKTGSTKPIHLNDLVKQLKEQMAQSSLNMKGKNATILVVDDDNSIRSLLVQELGDAGYIIEEATNGKEALASIRNHRPDLVILDVMMPEMNGFDVAAILKNDPQTMDIPIIVLSIVQDKARGFRIGVDRYLTKPIDTAQLFTEVGSLLEQGKSKKKVMVVDEDSTAVRTLTDVLQAKGYQVVESDGKEMVEKAIRTQPDIIILNSVLSDKHEIVQSLRFEKGLENVLFLIYQ